MNYISTTDQEALRALKNNPAIVSTELFKAEPNGHAFQVGDKCLLHGLVDFPEYNGDGNEIGIQNVDPISVIGCMAGTAQEALHKTS